MSRNQDEFERYQRATPDRMEDNQPSQRRRRSQASRLKEEQDVQPAAPRAQSDAYARPEAEPRAALYDDDGGDYASGTRSAQTEPRYDRSRNVGGEPEVAAFARPGASRNRKAESPAKPSYDEYDDGYDDADAYRGGRNYGDEAPERDRHAGRDPYSRYDGGKGRYDRDEDDRYDRDDGGYDDEYEDDGYDDGRRGGSRWWVWLLVVLLVLALLFGVTFYFAKNSDIAIPRVIEPAVSFVRDLITEPTPTPAPTPEPTPTPAPTPTPPPAVTDAVVIGFNADPAVLTTLETPVTFQITTSQLTDRLQIVDSNGQMLMELSDGYSDTANGRVWRMMYYFASPYEGIIEVYPGNVSGWNDAAAAGTYMKAGEAQPEPTQPPVAEATAEPEAEPLAQAMASNADGSAPVDMTESIYVSGTAQSSFTRASAMNLADAESYASMNGVLTYRVSGMRQNGAYGDVAISENALAEAWTAETAATVTAKDGWAAQPLIAQWHANIRQSMPLTSKAMKKSVLKEIIFAANDGKIYFFDLETGEATRDPITVDVPMLGTASIYPNGIPLLFVGGTDSEGGGLFVYNLVSSKKICFINGSDSTAFSSSRAFLSAPLIDPAADAMVTAGGNGLLYTLTMNKTVETKKDGEVTLIDAIKIDPKLEVYRAQAQSEDTTVDSVTAAAGEYVYSASKGGVIDCVNVNTLSSRWALNIGAETGASLALDSAGSLTLYAGTRNSESAILRRINAEDGTVEWFQEFEGDFSSAPVVGQNDIRDLVIFTVNSGSTATVYALSKADGSMVWSYALGASTLSSPIALYGRDAEAAASTEEAVAEFGSSQSADGAAGLGAWVVQGDDKGTLVLLDALTGAETARLELGSGVTGSPVAFNSVLVVPTQDGKLHGVTVK